MDRKRIRCQVIDKWTVKKVLFWFFVIEMLNGETSRWLWSFSFPFLSFFSRHSSKPNFSLCIPQSLIFHPVWRVSCVMLWDFSTEGKPPFGLAGSPFFRTRLKSNSAKIFLLSTFPPFSNVGKYFNIILLMLNTRHETIWRPWEIRHQIKAEHVKPSRSSNKYVGGIRVGTSGVEKTFRAVLFRN